MEDITRNKHKGNEASVAAFQRLEKVTSREAVLDAFRDLGGLSYSKQIAEHLNRDLHVISGRISELKRDGLLVSADLGRLNGCEVLSLVMNAAK